MARVIAPLFTSADGFGQEIQRYVEEAHRFDVMLLGRVTYEILAGYWPTARVEDDPMPTDERSAKAGVRRLRPDPARLVQAEVLDSRVVAVEWEIAR